MGYGIRTAGPDEWQRIRELRLEALSDPIAHLAFGSTYQREAALTDEEWQLRAQRGTGFVAEDTNGVWVGSATVLMETGTEYPIPQAHVVGMYVRPEVRGGGTAERLLRAAVEWSWRQQEVERVRLWVTDANPRAFAFYTRLGFGKTGVSAPHPPDRSLTGYEMELARPR
ncbi:GNAT family N-acetyltransferase [Streptantibioticus ferralitis]|uniref:GNAT family N-acetyltransferase n=1 Tax=Streptantibioticus ferralitis TaxID=236510 RepID=A0ABT5Z651_9ACTN|nr:GNAT family N-acetyltransferase [Streptantibioticus ferralitis]MDF2259294.1 GNAT family N-acetyltransferase [Streptantibioticus ferralitis]